jgi:hypothetical protein
LFETPIRGYTVDSSIKQRVLKGRSSSYPVYYKHVDIEMRIDAILREFARTLAEAAGYKLDWVGTGVGANKRNALYIARDGALLELSCPGLAPQRDGNAESLERIVRDALTITG